MDNEIKNTDVENNQEKPFDPMMVDKFASALTNNGVGEISSAIDSKVEEASGKLANQTEKGYTVTAATETALEVEKNPVGFQSSSDDVKSGEEAAFQKIVTGQGIKEQKNHEKSKTDFVKGGNRNNKWAAETVKKEDEETPAKSKIEVAERTRISHKQGKTVENVKASNDKEKASGENKNNSAEVAAKKEFFLSTINNAQDASSLEKAIKLAKSGGMNKELDLIKAADSRRKDLESQTPKNTKENKIEKEEFIKGQVGVLRSVYQKGGFKGLTTALGRERYLDGNLTKDDFIPKLDKEGRYIWRNIPNAKEVRKAAQILESEVNEKAKVSQKELDRLEGTKGNMDHLDAEFENKYIVVGKEKADNNGNVNKGDIVDSEQLSSVLDPISEESKQTQTKDDKPTMRSVSEWTREDLDKAAEETGNTAEEVRELVKSKNQYTGYMKGEGATVDEEGRLKINNITDNFIEHSRAEMAKELTARGARDKVDEIVENQEQNDPFSSKFVAPEFNPPVLEKDKNHQIENIKRNINELIDQDSQLDHSTPEGSLQHKELKEKIIALMDNLSQQTQGEEAESADRKILDPSDPNYVFDPESVGKDENIGARSSEDIIKELDFLINQDRQIEQPKIPEEVEQHKEFLERISFLQNILNKRGGGGEKGNASDNKDNGDLQPPVEGGNAGGGGDKDPGDEGRGPDDSNPEDDKEKPEPQEETKAEREVLSQAEYQALLDARSPYLKALAGRRKWFRRTDPEILKTTREEYEKATNIYIAKEAQKIVEAEHPELAGAEKEKAIIMLASNLLINEFTDKTDAEIKLANEGAGRRFLNWFKKHPYLRMAAGAALTVGAVATGGGAAGLAVLGARAIWGGVSSAIATEGAIDAAHGSLSGRYGQRKELSAEDVRAMSTFGIDEKLALHLARSVRRGENVENSDRAETVDNLLAERERDLKANIERMTSEGKTGDQIRKTILESTLEDVNTALEKGQEDERRRSIKRWVVAGAIGLITGGLIAKAGLDRMGESTPSHTGGGTPHEAAPVAPAPVESVPVPTQADLIHNFSVTEVAGRGDGEWHLAARALHGFTDKFGISLDSRHQTIAIDWMKDHLIAPHEGQIVPSPSHWISIGHSHVFGGDFVKQAIDYAKAH